MRKPANCGLFFIWGEKMARPFNFINYGNLYFYPGFKPDFFYFNSLLSNYEMNPPNKFYSTYAKNIGYNAKARLSNIPGIGTEQSDKDNFLLDQIEQILQILDVAIEQEKSNEIKFVDNKLAMLKNNMNSKYYKKNQDIAAIENLLQQLKTDNGIDYNALITLINIVEQGFDNSKAIIDFEKQHLEELDKAVKKIVKL